MFGEQESTQQRAVNDSVKNYLSQIRKDAKIKAKQALKNALEDD